MHLRFAGTRGEIEARTPRHFMHTSLLVVFRRRRVMIDCGLDWIGHLAKISPHAICITHAHPDHAWGLKQGAPCPVYARDISWRDMRLYPIEQRRVVKPREPFLVEGISFEAFALEHSTRCPAVGYRVSAGGVAIFYSPDLVYIHERAEALRGCRAYIGDGATLTRSMVRKRGDNLIGHATVQTQLTWCQKEGVPLAVITHCGSEIVTGDEAQIAARIEELAAARGGEARLGYDGREMTLR